MPAKGVRKEGRPRKGAREPIPADVKWPDADKTWAWANIRGQMDLLDVTIPQGDWEMFENSYMAICVCAQAPGGREGEDYEGGAMAIMLTHQSSKRPDHVQVHTFSAQDMDQNTANAMRVYQDAQAVCDHLAVPPHRRFLVTPYTLTEREEYNEQHGKYLFGRGRIVTVLSGAESEPGPDLLEILMYKQADMEFLERLAKDKDWEERSRLSLLYPENNMFKYEARPAILGAYSFGLMLSWSRNPGKYRWKP